MASRIGTGAGNVGDYQVRQRSGRAQNPNEDSNQPQDGNRHEGSAQNSGSYSQNPQSISHYNTSEYQSENTNNANQGDDELAQDLGTDSAANVNDVDMHDVSDEEFNTENT